MALINTISDVTELTPPLINEIISMISNEDSLLRQTGLRGMEVLEDKILLPLSSVMGALMVACNDTISENSILANRYGMRLRICMRMGMRSGLRLGI